MRFLKEPLSYKSLFRILIQNLLHHSFSQFKAWQERKPLPTNNAFGINDHGMRDARDPDLALHAFLRIDSGEVGHLWLGHFPDNLFLLVGKSNDDQLISKILVDPIQLWNRLSTRAAPSGPKID